MTRAVWLLLAVPAGLVAGCHALREPAKTTVAIAPTEAFASLHALLASLPPDEEMRPEHRELRRIGGRVPVEDRNVAVEAWVYAAAREPDGDYHLMLGDGPVRPTEFMTAEITRVPAKSGDASGLGAVRAQFHAIFGRLYGLGFYKRITPPRHVRVTGSLFYDIDHRPGHVGPRDAAPTTAWAIHPLTSLEELPPAGRASATGAGDRAR